MQSSVARIVTGMITAAALAGSAACNETSQIPVSDTTAPQLSRVPFPVPSWMLTTSNVPVQQQQTTAPTTTTVVVARRTTTRPRPRTTTRPPTRTTTTTQPLPPPPTTTT